MSDTPEEAPTSDNIAMSVPSDAAVIAGGESLIAIAPVETPQQAKERADREDRKKTLNHFMWLGLAFILPLAFIYLTSREDDRGALIFHGVRLGVTSFFVALGIIGLAQLDRKITNSSMDPKSQFLASLLGMMLWLVWVGSGQMVFKAVDEAKAGAIFDQNR